MAAGAAVSVSVGLISPGYKVIPYVSCVSCFACPVLFVCLVLSLSLGCQLILLTALSGDAVG